MANRQRGTSDDGAPASVDQALREAAVHARAALAEAILAARSLLDAASLGISGKPAALESGEAAQASDTRLALAAMARGLDELASRAGAQDALLPAPIIVALIDALDAEIARWEERSDRDPDARAVLRAFLGLRELLWEVGIRRPTGGAASPQPAGRERKRPANERDAAHDGGATDAPAAASAAQASDGAADTASTGASFPPHESRPRVQRVKVKG